MFNLLHPEHPGNMDLKYSNKLESWINIQLDNFSIADSEIFICDHDDQIEG